MIKGGKVVWSYSDPDVKGAHYDATLLPNGNLLLAHGQAVRALRVDDPQRRLHDGLAGKRGPADRP